LNITQARPQQWTLAYARPGTISILFLDADVTGHTAQMLQRVTQPVVDGRFEMYVGVRARETIWLNRLLHFFPIIGGERAVTRRLWEAVPAKYREGVQIEIALNHTAKKFKKGMGFELVAGTRHYIKEEKYGLSLGLLRRTKMIHDIVAISVRLYVLEGISSKLKSLRLKMMSLRRP